jgi:murein L,D-transpeptidase YcbB/YkuD
MLLLLFAVVACGDRGREAPPTAAGPSPSRFQRHLDRLGIPLQLPPRGKMILVNIPAFELIAFEDAEPVLTSRIIVGAPWHPTPVLRTHTTAVRFRPTWRPTPAMVRSGEYEDKVWPPGRKNPLGLAAIRLGPGLLVYLHDTNRRDLFGRDDRALSHGCIRVQHWDELVAWVLGIEIAEVHRLANGRRTFDYPAAPIPVILGYYTIFPDAAGRPVSHADVYERSASAAEPSSSAACGPTG